VRCKLPSAIIPTTNGKSYAEISKPMTWAFYDTKGAALNNYDDATHTTSVADDTAGFYTCKTGETCNTISAKDNFFGPPEAGGPLAENAASTTDTFKWGSQLNRVLITSYRQNDDGNLIPLSDNPLSDNPLSDKNTFGIDSTGKLSAVGTNAGDGNAASIVVFKVGGVKQSTFCMARRKSMITMGSPYFVWINTNEIISSWCLLDAVCVTPPFKVSDRPFKTSTALGETTYKTCEDANDKDSTGRVIFDTNLPRWRDHRSQTSDCDEYEDNPDLCRMAGTFYFNPQVCELLRTLRTFIEGNEDSVRED
jgi:hypothetical protein